MRIERLAILGVGLIGGSLARALKAADACGEVVGFGRDAAHLQRAVELGVIDRAGTDLGEVVAGADLVVAAVPIGAMDPLLGKLAACLGDETVVTDVGSVKRTVLESAQERLGAGFARFVAGHPIAGTEKSGVEASRAELFQGHRVILTPHADTGGPALALVRGMWETVGAEVIEMDAALHDEVLAATSHLPHILAYTLVDALARMKEHDDIFRYAAGGFADFTRIAASSPQMWHDICLANRDALLDVLKGFRSDLDDFADAVLQADSQRIFDLFSRAKAARDALDQKD